MEPLSEGYLNALQMLMPCMHAALERVAAMNRQTSSCRTNSHPVLTEKEREILVLISQGKTNWEIAHILGGSEHTVKTHVHCLLQKLKVSTRTQAALWLLGDWRAEFMK